MTSQGGDADLTRFLEFNMKLRNNELVAWRCALKLDLVVVGAVKLDLVNSTASGSQSTVWGSWGMWAAGCCWSLVCR